MVKVTLYNFTRNMIREEGNTFHVDISNDRVGSVDRVESPAAGVRKTDTDKSRRMGEEHIPLKDAPGFDGGVNWNDKPTQQELDAERELFKRMGLNRHRV